MTLDPLPILQSTFGFPAFRGVQGSVVERVLAGRNTLAVMPTGAGKSLCYQLPALALPGTCVVVSPLIALMHDQLRAATAIGISAATLTSVDTDQMETIARFRRGELDLLYVAPERASSGSFRDLLGQAPLALFAIDEAHCVSEWGHDFRPDFRLLRPLLDAFPSVPRLALTATADAHTRADILDQLGIPHEGMIVAGFDRPNIQYRISPKDNATRQIADLIAETPGAGIVYVQSRAGTEKMAEALAKTGRPTRAYHAGLDPAVRARNQADFVASEDMVMCATVAFGMGIDKPDVRFVCHADLPSNVEAYYQEIGRAGRDGLPADTLTLYGLGDMQLRRLQIEQGDSSDERKRIERQRLNALLALAEAPRCRRQTLLAYFGEASEPCGNCDLCVEGVELFDATVDAQKAMSAIVRTGERFGMEHLVAILTGDLTDNVAKFKHDALPTFGVGKNRKATDWRSIFRQLSAVGLIAQDLMEHGRWWVTDEGWSVLKGRQKVELRKIAASATSKGERRGRAAAPPIVSDADSELLDSLRTLRTRLARAQNVPAYVVFSDRTLVELATHRPSTLAAMREIHGIGDAKLERYGAEFLAVMEPRAS